MSIGTLAWPPLGDEQRELLSLVRTLAAERIAPRAAEIDETHAFPWDVVELFREQGLFGLFFEERHGGTGTGPLLALAATETACLCGLANTDRTGANGRPVSTSWGSLVRAQ